MHSHDRRLMIEEKEFEALRAAGWEDHKNDLGMYKSLIFRHFSGVMFLAIREHSGYDGASYTLIKRFELAEAWRFKEKHPIVRFLFSSDAEEAKQAAEQEKAMQNDPCKDWNFRTKISHDINHTISQGAASGAEDLALAEYLASCLTTYDHARRQLTPIIQQQLEADPEVAETVETHDAVLEEWEFVRILYSDNWCLTGKIYNDVAGRFRDGEYVTTSSIPDFDGSQGNHIEVAPGYVAKTRNTKYLLGTPKKPS